MTDHAAAPTPSEEGKPTIRAALLALLPEEGGA
jgi:hypothetical protein